MPTDRDKLIEALAMLDAHRYVDSREAWEVVVKLAGPIPRAMVLGGNMNIGVIALAARAVIEKEKEGA
jgi:hypothetical protein